MGLNAALISSVKRKTYFALSGIETRSSVIHPLGQSLQATFQVLTTVLLRKSSGM